MAKSEKLNMVVLKKIRRRKMKATAKIIAKYTACCLGSSDLLVNNNPDVFFKLFKMLFILSNYPASSISLPVISDIRLFLNNGTCLL